jgi:protein-disulfide isomerase
MEEKIEINKTNEIDLDQNESNNKEQIIRNFPLILSIIMLISVGIGIGVGFLIWGYEPPIEIAPLDIPEDAQRYEFSYLEGTPVRGEADAPILMIEFTDFECPYCLKFNQEVYPLLTKNYKNDLQYVFIPFPLDSIHPNAMNASLASMCANDQNAFWEYRDLAFTADEGYTNEAFISYADQLNLDTDLFSTCLDEETHRELIEENIQRAIDLGVASTPTFLINGLPVMGAQPYELFAGVIEAELLSVEK